MATSLRDIPGARPSRPALFRRRGRLGPVAPYRPTLLRDPSAGLRTPGRGGPPRRVYHRRDVDWFLVAIITACLLLVGWFAYNGWKANRVEIAVHGFEGGRVLDDASAAAFAVSVHVGPDHRLERTDIRIDGRSVLGDAQALDQGFRFAPDGELGEGEHTVEVIVPRPYMGTAKHRTTFTVDRTPPTLDVPGLLDRAPIDQEVTIAGTVEDGAELYVGDEELDVDDGRFSVSYDHPPAGPVMFTAVDDAGNVTKREVIVPVRHKPGKGVHVSAAAWAHDELRAGVLRLIDEGKIDTVELSLKDEGGTMGYRSRVALAEKVGATDDLFELEDAVDELHSRGVRVVGRLVAFRDPVLADWAWENGHRDWVVQLTDGRRHPSYGGFLNFAHPEVRKYQYDIAMEAVDAGIDEILYDYVRRPEGDLEQMVIPGLRGTPEDGVVEFLAESHEMLRARGVLQGASVFGIAADRPKAIGQDVPRIARHTDIISPMVYPSLWVKGEYRVPDPTNMPYEIVKASLAEFQAKTEGTGAVLVPWLQDFSMGRVYDDDEVRAQIDAARDLGIEGWLLWSPRVRYHGGLLDQVD